MEKQQFSGLPMRAGIRKVTLDFQKNAFPSSSTPDKVRFPGIFQP